MYKGRCFLLLSFSLLLILSNPLFISKAKANTPTPTPDYAALQQKLTVCHATQNNNNPYKQIVIGGHDGVDNYYSLIAGIKYSANDIIPPNGSFNQKWWGQNINFSKGAQNWTIEGQAIWNNACVVSSIPTPTVESVPEFGVVPGVIASIISAGSFLAFKKRC